MKTRPSLRTKRAAAWWPDWPNAVMLVAADIGSAYVDIDTHGMLVPTHNLNRLARECLLFTFHFGGSQRPDDATRRPPASKPCACV